MRLFKAGTDHHVDYELRRLLKNALGNRRPPVGSRARLLENAAKLSPELLSDDGITSRIWLLFKALQHQRWMTGDYGLGQDVKHSYLAGVAHISIA
jgi:hypothetical protein